jgi:predicted metalloprotease
MAEEKKAQSQKVIIIVLIIVIVLLVAGGAVAAVILLGGQNTANVAQTTTAPTATQAAGTIKKNDNPLILDYDNSAVALDEDTLQKQFEELQEKAKNGYVNLEFQNVASSSDGINFECHFGNAAANVEDMFFNIYKDMTLEEQIYLSGLVAPGNAINSFVSEIKLDPGEYKAIIFFTTVSEDHQTMTSQTPVELTLKVKKR